MRKSIGDYESEIVAQISIAEACFGICADIPQISGLGNHMFSFLFNLSISKGILALHSILQPTEDEISFKGYIALSKSSGRSRTETDLFQKQIADIRKHFVEATPWPLRHKAVAHLDSQFKHKDFMLAYLASNYLTDFQVITSNLKSSFFPYVNYSMNDYPMMKVREQIREILIFLNGKEGRPALAFEDKKNGSL